MLHDTVRLLLSSISHWLAVHWHSLLLLLLLLVVVMTDARHVIQLAVAPVPGHPVVISSDAKVSVQTPYRVGGSSERGTAANGTATVQLIFIGTV